MTPPSITTSITLIKLCVFKTSYDFFHRRCFSVHQQIGTEKFGSQDETSADSESHNTNTQNNLPEWNLRYSQPYHHSDWGGERDDGKNYRNHTVRILDNRRHKK
jgi:hypothetical protein